ncbi:hypothetical protein MPTK1_2g18090 [Marchantia polymorpha subsp. ruderalis]|nr:hypothetical protein Mp_2g18090 [Marchantia polymorpha subsp. ruderalis]
MEAVTSREVYRRNMSEEFSSFLCAANSGVPSPCTLTGLCCGVLLARLGVAVV